MTDLENGLRDLSWVAAPRPLPDLETGASRRRRRRNAGVGVIGMTTAVGVVVALLVGGYGPRSDSLVPATQTSGCPSTFALPSAGPATKLFPDDVVDFRICVYDPVTVTGYTPEQLAGGQLRQSLGLPASLSVAAAAAAFRNIGTAGSPDCLAFKQVRVLVIATTANGTRVLAALTNPCGEYFTNGTFTSGNPGALAGELGIDPLDLLAPTRPADPADSDLVRVAGILFDRSRLKADLGGEVRFTRRDTGEVTTAPASGGRYFVYLPAGSYDVTAKAQTLQGRRCDSYPDVSLSGREQTVGIECR